MKKLVTIDFETKAIQPRPAYPPPPVGVAIGDGRSREYMAWGHPAENNCSQSDAKHRLQSYWRNPEVELLFHHGKFDLDVAETWLGLPLPPWQRVHDTLYLLYLDDPRATSFSLKPASERILRLPPTEQEAVRDWLVEHGIVRKADQSWGAKIAEAPGKLVGRYAIGDIDRTLKLYRHLRPIVSERGMDEAYDRERRLMPVLLDNERRGVTVNHNRLRADVRSYMTVLNDLDGWLRKQLKAPDLDIDSDEQLANALDRAGLVKDWTLTAKGNRSTSKKNLKVDNPRIMAALSYRSVLATCLRTFMAPWLATADLTGGLIHTNWNSVRGENKRGTTTGRLSSNPNLQNIPTNEMLEKAETEVIKLKMKLPPLPRVRRYIIGDTAKHAIGSSDYSQQELRALGHFEDGPLLEAYHQNPRMDIHDYARTMVNKMLGTQLERKPIKNLSFGLLYGMGKDKTAASMGVDVDTAQRIKRAYLSIFPGLDDLIRDLKRRARSNEPIRTWGGREYFVEQPKIIKGRMRTFEYRMLNVLIQGSSADCTKEAMIRYFYDYRQHGRILAQVHDQILISAPRINIKTELRRLQDAMESVEFDVQMLTDGSIGSSWAELEDVVDEREAA